MKKIIRNILLTIILISKVEPSGDNNVSSKNIIGSKLKVIAGSAIMYITSKYTHVKIEKKNNSEDNKPCRVAIIDRRTQITIEKENKIETRYIDDKIEVDKLKDFKKNVKVENLGRREINSLKSKNEDLGYEISILRKQNKELQKNLNYYKRLLGADNKNLKLEISSLKNQKKELKKTLNTCKDSLKNVSLSKQDLALKIENLEYQNKKLQKSMGYHRNLLKKTNKTLEQYKNVKNNNNMLEGNNNQLSLLEQRNNEIESRILNKQKIIESLRLEEREMLIPILNHTAVMGKDKSYDPKVEEEMEKAQEQVNIIDSQVNKLINDIEKLKKEKLAYEKKGKNRQIVFNIRQKELEDNIIKARIICQKLENIS